MTMSTLNPYDLAEAWVYLQKQSQAAEIAHSLAGRLYASRSGWILMAVPNALARGAFAALHEPGAELPLNADGNLRAHVSVMRPEELESLGGPDAITERGQEFAYTLGPVKSVVPATWNGVGRVWYIQIVSPALRELRRAYGLSSQPRDDWDFHITFAIRKTGVLRENSTSKAASVIHRRGRELLSPEERTFCKDAVHVPTIGVDFDGTICKKTEKFEPDVTKLELRTGVRKGLRKAQEQGVRIIVWTCRDQDPDIQAYLDDHNLSQITHINSNPDQPPGTSGKLFADAYIDDKAIDGSGDFGEAMEQALARIKSEKQADSDPAIEIDRPKGYRKTFQTQQGPRELVYPLDYGYFRGVTNPQDNEGADVFVGGEPEGLHGRFMKGKPDGKGGWLPDEHKWYTQLSEADLQALREWWDRSHPDPGVTWDWTSYPDRRALLASLPAGS